MNGIMLWPPRPTVYLRSCIYGHVYMLYCCYIFIFVQTKKKHFKNEQRSRDAAAKKRANTSGVGKSNNYYEDIYIPSYNNAH